MKTGLTREASGIIIPRVEIFGPQGVVQVNMILDTGAAYTMIDRTTAQKLGYRPSHAMRKVRIVTANGSIHVPLIHIQKMALHDICAAHVPVIVHDIPGIVDVEGLLGLSFLRHFRTTIDYRRLHLTIE